MAIDIVYDTQITIFRWVYKPTNMTGGPHPATWLVYGWEHIPIENGG